MDKAKDAVSGFLHHNNKHSVDIEQTTAPAVVHERVQEAQHTNVTTAIDREVHQHHHQTHVQPIQDKVVEAEQHHHNVLPVEHRQVHHGKDRDVEVHLKEQAGQFRDEVERLPTQSSQSQNTVVGEHVHHHIHDTIQPVIERERLQQHVVHTTKQIHERIDKEPVIHSGNVLPTKTLAEFQASGHSLTGGVHKPEHIDYEGDPLKIKDDSRVGFDHHGRHEGLGSSGAPGELGTRTGLSGAAGIAGHHHHHTTAGPHDSNLANKADPRVDSDRDGRSGLGNTTGVGGVSSLTGKTTAGPHDSNMANKMDPRVDSDRDGKSGLGGSTGMGTGYGSSTTGTTGTTGLGGSSNYSTGNTGTSGYDTSSNPLSNTAPRTAGSEGYGNTTGSGLGSGTTGLSERAGHDTVTDKPSTTDKLLAKVGLK